MKILLTDEIVQLLKRELPRAGRREIGGLLMGEYVRDGVFRIVEISVQRSGGNEACFIRDPREHQAQLDEFFARHGHDYGRFNYIGEWHSHPSYPAFPSPDDFTTMSSIVADPEVGVNFLILVIVKMKRDRLELSATAFRPGQAPMVVEVALEEGERVEAPASLRAWVCELFRWLGFSRGIA